MKKGFLILAVFTTLSCSKENGYSILQHHYEKKGIVFPDSNQFIEDSTIDDHDENLSCSAFPNNLTEWRERFEKEFVLLGKECVKEKQLRSCVNGLWSNWSGSFVYKQCSSEKYLSIFADTKDECQKEIKSEFETKMNLEECVVGGACGKSCGKPSTNCASSYPDKFGICFDSSDLLNKF